MLTSLRGCRQLLRIRAYDEQHGTDNLAFLRAYLRYERRTTVVAEKLHMHRNTLLHRIKRIEELLGSTFDDWTLRRMLLLSFDYLYLDDDRDI